MLQELKALFDLFDADGDGHLEVEEVSAICSSCGIALTEAEVLDMVTELKPDIRKLPFEEVRNSGSEHRRHVRLRWCTSWLYHHLFSPLQPFLDARLSHCPPPLAHHRRSLST